MIISRYISKQVLQVTTAITFILLVVVVIGRMLKYLAQASQGEIDASVLALLMSYRLPEFIQLTLPLALMLGVLLSYGRLYAESEMTVLTACGVSQKRLLGIAFIPATLVALVVAALSLHVTPWGLVNADRLLEMQKELTEFDVLAPGHFQQLSRGARTTYTEDVSDGQMRNVFMYESGQARATVASTAVAERDAEGQRYVLMERGSVVQGQPGQSEYAVTRFSELGVRLPAQEISFDMQLPEKALPTLRLLRTGDALLQAELQWRVSLILIIPVLMILVVPLSKVSPREGRFARLIPAILLYILYFGLLLGSRDMLSDGRLPPAIGLWWVHLLFLAIAVMLFEQRLPLLARWLRKR